VEKEDEGISVAVTVNSPQAVVAKPRQEPPPPQHQRWVCRLDEQLAAAQRNSTLLDDQIKILREENLEMKGFIRDGNA